VAPSKRKRLKPGERIALSLPLAQVDLIMAHAFISEHLLALIYAAKVRDNVVRVKCTFDDLDQLSKYVENEASNTKDMKLQQELGTIFEAIRKLEQSYYGAPLRIIPNGMSDKHMCPKDK